MCRTPRNTQSWLFSSSSTTASNLRTDKGRSRITGSGLLLVSGNSEPCVLFPGRFLGLGNGSVVDLPRFPAFYIGRDRRILLFTIGPFTLGAITARLCTFGHWDLLGFLVLVPVTDIPAKLVQLVLNGFRGFGEAFLGAA